MARGAVRRPPAVTARRPGPRLPAWRPDPPAEQDPISALLGRPPTDAFPSAQVGGSGWWLPPDLGRFSRIHVSTVSISQTLPWASPTTGSGKFCR